MSCNISYIPMAEAKGLPTWTPSAKMGQLSDIFDIDRNYINGLVLGSGALPRLEAAMVVDSDNEKKFWKELIKAIKKYGTVMIDIEC